MKKLFLIINIFLTCSFQSLEQDKTATIKPSKQVLKPRNEPTETTTTTIAEPSKQVLKPHNESTNTTTIDEFSKQIPQPNNEIKNIKKPVQNPSIYDRSNDARIPTFDEGRTQGWGEAVIISIFLFALLAYFFGCLTILVDLV